MTGAILFKHSKYTVGELTVNTCYVDLDYRSKVFILLMLVGFATVMTFRWFKGEFG